MRRHSCLPFRYAWRYLFRAGSPTLSFPEGIFSSYGIRCLILPRFPPGMTAWGDLAGLGHRLPGSLMRYLHPSIAATDPYTPTNYLSHEPEAPTYPHQPLSQVRLSRIRAYAVPFAAPQGRVPVVTGRKARPGHGVDWCSTTNSSPARNASLPTSTTNCARPATFSACWTNTSTTPPPSPASAAFTFAQCPAARFGYPQGGSADPQRSSA